MERWIVFSNCQTRGITNCLSLQNPDADVTPCEFLTLIQNPAVWAEALPQFDRIFATQEILGLGLMDFAAFGNLTILPSIQFGGFHPDICYASSPQGTTKTPMDDYNSIICLAAFNKGLSEADTLKLFNRSTYMAGGYFEIWALEKRQMFDHFSDCGVDLSADFRRWSMRGSFMYSVNHPRIECLYDVAAQMTRRIGREPLLDWLRPHDNAANAVVFPVYDEIAEELGIPGSYHFKPGGQYRFLSLEAFIAGSFAAYRQFPSTTFGIFEARYNAVFNAI